MLAKKGESPAPVVGNEALKTADNGKCLDRSFSQNQSQNQTGRRAAAISTLLMLRGRFPAAFARLDLPHRQPLKVGIANDIAAALPEIGAADIGLALKIYTGHAAYLAQCTEGAGRIDLDGQQVGAVSTKEASYASELLGTKRKRSPKSAPRSSSPPKKITLDDLRTAARKRAAVTP